MWTLRRQRGAARVGARRGLVIRRSRGTGGAEPGTVRIGRVVATVRRGVGDFGLRHRRALRHTQVGDRVHADPRHPDSTHGGEEPGCQHRSRCPSHGRHCARDSSLAGMGKVLLIEDDTEIRLALVRALSDRDYTVRSCGDAMSGIREVTEWKPACVVLDLGLPDLPGGSVLRMIRAVSTVPVIIATADDYVVKPFSADHLAARIGAVLRRVSTTPAATRVAVGGLQVDPDAREAVLDGEQLQLSRREFDLLAYLAARAGRVVSRSELLAEVWHQPYGRDDQTIDVHVSWLRRKLGETAAQPRYLHTVRGVGVKLTAPEDQ